MAFKYINMEKILAYIKPIRMHVAALLLFLATFIFSSFFGFSFLGDDNVSTDHVAQGSGGRAHGVFFHK